MIKKFFCILLIFILCAPIFALTIETSKGIKEVTIPDGMTAEEAFCEMSRLYLEERWAHEDLIASSQDLTKSISDYQDKVNTLTESYDELLDDYNNLSTLYNSKTKIQPLQPIIGAHISTKVATTDFSFGLDLQALVFNKILVTTSISYPLQIGLGLGIKF